MAAGNEAAKLAVVMVQSLRDVATGEGIEIVMLLVRGGVGSPEHLRAGLLEGRASAVLAATIFHDGTWSIGRVKRFLAAAGVSVRLTPDMAPAPQ